MVEVPRDTFDKLVADAIASLPENYRAALDVVRVEVRDRPTPEQLRSVGLEEEELLFGLYVGVPLTERSVEASGTLPDVIYLFREDHEDACDDLTGLAEQVRVTVWHELGHYFGLDEDGLAAVGYD